MKAVFTSIRHIKIILNTDLYSEMYSDEVIDVYFSDVSQTKKKPFLLCEYSHAMGNQW